jgi:hypothetical protein
MTKLYEQFRRMQTLISENSEHGVSGDQINVILRGYLACALWTEEEELNPLPDEPEDDEDDYDDEDEMDRLVRTTANPQVQQQHQGYTVDSFTDDSKIQAYLDIKKFLGLAGEEAVWYMVADQGFERLGHDIWLTRNHHGAGFFDHSFDDEIEQPLINAGHALGEIQIHVNDDGMLSFSNELNESIINDLQPIMQHIKHTGLTVPLIKQVLQYVRTKGYPVEDALKQLGVTWDEVKSKLAAHKPKLPPIQGDQGLSPR